MRAYIIRRLLSIIPTFIVITMTVFVIIRFIPGDVLDIMIMQMGESGATAGFDRDALEHAMGLDESIPVQYLRWVGAMPDRETGEFSGIIQGSLGESIWTNRPVFSEILPRIPVSLELGLMAIIFGILIALPIGIYSAIRQDTIGDYVGRSIAILFLAVPGFWVATMVVVFPAIWWGWMPPIEYIPFTSDPLGNLGQFLIPATILGLALGGGMMRLTRTVMLEVLRQDYIKTAWSKGLRERVVVVRHALRNGLIPIVTAMGLQVPLLIGGSVIMEQIFVLPGVGRLAVAALNQRDYAIISGVNVVLASVVLLNNLVIDLTYGALDPRIRYQ